MSPNALITGAARGIGRAIALRFARDGLNVAVNDIEASSSDLSKVQQEIEKMGRKSVALIADVSIDKASYLPVGSTYPKIFQTPKFVTSRNNGYVHKSLPSFDNDSLNNDPSLLQFQEKILE
ncbi:unnamed protein product [Rotaria sp. Silwood1]|nr:unnamed protein product [Rotaria sp. Silwood1]